ncbi:hypothetical protein K458DRAFT_389453 [Lentithecium fluviatile CBS 122367]|uniref:Uncharacterized protein n=1 Tax=Lentithecium fluviatile CBS 122367 TaxID=1168545 RepID=A0A6G1J160_9PLEO|nr:hypothetical protein K458DRAFT_389453 [Lentithecium fluviatile CBS 122367]
MADEHHIPHEPTSDLGRARSHCLNIFRKMKHGKSPQRKRAIRSSQASSPLQSPPLSARLPSIFGTHDALPDAAIWRQFSDVHEAIVTHVERFYATKPVHRSVSPAIIEHASAGITLPRRQIIRLLDEPQTRLATLALCIAWTIRSRSLLLKLGISSSPGNAFSHFDSRTINIERALKDLDPLLTIYASPHGAGRTDGARVEDLRDVLRRGAKFAFTLSSQPSFWKFAWTSDRAIEHGKAEYQHDPEVFIVRWPSLVRVMDGEGVTLEGECDGIVIGKQVHLEDFSA